MSGWIKIHRSILEWEWWDDAESVKLFLYLILRANHEEKRWQGQVIKRGQFITSLDKLARANSLTVQKVRTRLERFISSGEITTKGTNKNTIITICNYEDYQDKKDDEQQTNNNPITNEQQSNNNKQELKNYKNISILSKGEERKIFESLISTMEEIINNQAVIEDFQRTIGKPYPTVEETQDYVKEFFAKLTVDGETEKIRKDAIYHFKSWIKQEIEAKRNENKNKGVLKNGNKPKSYTVGEGINFIGGCDAKRTDADREAEARRQYINDKAKRAIAEANRINHS